MQTAEQVIQQLEAAGFYARFLPIEAMEQVREHYDTLAQRAPETVWIKNAVEHFGKNQPPKLDFEPKSFLVTACPRPGGKIALHRSGRVIEIPIPPTCLNAPLPGGFWEAIVASLDCRTAYTKGISIKLLTVLSGLGQYGRNNICYVEGCGSYVSLGACYTDIPCNGPVYNAHRMEACETCDLCRKACPTGAIGEKQVIDASHCLAYLNNGRKRRMPRWVPKNAHHTLVECLRCQECCPQNPQVDYSHTLELDEAETEQLLSRAKKMPENLERKLREFGMGNWNMQTMKRNAKLAAKAMRNA